MPKLSLECAFVHENEGIYATLNGMGFSYQDITIIGEAFVEWAGAQEKPVLDIGAAYGFAALKALQRGACVIANDLSPQHLEILTQRVTSDLAPGLTLKVGRFPEQLDFPEASLSGIFASNVLHFLRPRQLKEALQKIHSWLLPGGKIFVVVMSPYIECLKQVIPEFEAQKSGGAKWPGVMPSSRFKASGEIPVSLPEKIHVFDKITLERVFKEHDFIIDHVEYISRPNWPVEWQYDGRESVGLIASKPF